MAKLNIHLVLDQKAQQYCREVNAGIRKITKSVIVFDDKSPMIPHLSLYMGELDSDYTVPQLAQIVNEAASHTKHVKLRVFPPYIENVRNRYVFSDVAGDETFLKLRRRINDELKSKALHGEIDYSQDSHLTLGHVEDNREEVRRYLSGIQAGFDFCSDSIEISDVGIKGTCINSLYVYEFGHPSGV